MIKIQTWEVEEEDGADGANNNDVQGDVFVTVDDENVGPQNYHWRSEYGFHQVEIDPNTDSFKLGTYRVAFVTRT